MATITSAQSGNWEYGTTWVGGVVPTATDAVIVDMLHTITIASNKQRDSNLTLKGTLRVAQDIIVTHGARGGANPTLEFDGGTLSGAGAMHIQNGSVVCTGDSWSFVKESVSLTFDKKTFVYDSIRWNLSKLSWQSSGDLDIRYRTEVSNLGTNFSANNCCFVDGNITVGAEGSSLKDDISILNSTFFNVKKIRILGNNSKKVTLKNCSLYADVNTVLQLTGGEVDNCFVHNCYDALFFSGDGSHIKHSFLSLNASDSEGRFIVGSSSSNSNTSLVNSIVYCPQGGGNNTRIAILGNITGNFMEIMSLGGGNGVVCTSKYPINFTDNVYVGSGSVITNALTSNVAFNVSINNNTTIHSTGDISDASYAFEYYANDGKTYVARNNLHYALSVSEGQTTTYARGFGDTQPEGFIDVDIDYCAKYNINEWFLPIFNNTSGTKLIDADPNFKDTSRSVLTWANTLGLNSDDELFAYLLAMHGFDITTGTHSSFPKDISFIDVLAWLREGYTPQNMTLATAGEGGTYVGAVMPEEASNPIFFNGASFSRVTFNGQEIPTQNIVFKG